MKIMTLNVNGFNGEDERFVSNEVCIGYMESIKQLIDNVLNGANDIIILQEIPHMIFDNDGKFWSDNFLLFEFKRLFSEYKVIWPKHLINSRKCTVAVSHKESSWKEIKQDMLKFDRRHSYGNKFVELECENITLLGVHMPTEESMWDLLKDTLLCTPYTFIVGDFNANEKRGSMSKMPSILRQSGYNSFIPNNVITCYSYKTSIDNIYIATDYTLTNDITTNVKKTQFTDHALCILDYNP